MSCKYCTEFEDLPEHIINGKPVGKVFDVCCCYQLQKIGDEYIQYLKEGKEVHYKEKNGEYIEVK